MGACEESTALGAVNSFSEMALICNRTDRRTGCGSKLTQNHALIEQNTYNGNVECATNMWEAVAKGTALTVKGILMQAKQTGKGHGKLLCQHHGIIVPAV